MADLEHDGLVTVILHDLEDLYLVALETPAVAVNQVTEEIHQLRLEVALIVLDLYIPANLLDEVEHDSLVIQHSLVVIIHLLKKINGPNILLYVMDHLRNVPLHYRFYLVEVLYQTHDEVVAHVQKFCGQLGLREVFAVEDEVQHFKVQV